MGGGRWGEPEQRDRTPRVTFETERAAYRREAGEGEVAREPCASALARGGFRQGSGSGGLGLRKPSSRGVAITPHGSRLRAGLKGAWRGWGVTPVRRGNACRFRSSQRESVSLHARQSCMVMSAPSNSFRHDRSHAPFCAGRTAPDEAGTRLRYGGRPRLSPVNGQKKGRLAAPLSIQLPEVPD